MAAGAISPATDATVVLAANDLGMHCMDREFSIFSILPPFNAINAQVIGHDANGNPLLLEDLNVSVSYAAAGDATGSINSYSSGKTDFWLYAGSIFGVNLANGEGLTGLFMPADDPQSRGPQPMGFNLPQGWFSAAGIPITPTDDASTINPYPLVEIRAHDLQTNQFLGSLKVVAPVATETDCRGCHVTGGDASTRDGIVWAPDTDMEVQTKKNILKLHDAIQVTTLETSTPVFCSGCHYSKALDLAGSGPTRKPGRQSDLFVLGAQLARQSDERRVADISPRYYLLLPVSPRPDHPVPAGGHEDRRHGLH